MATHSSILAWRIPHGQRSLADYSPKGQKESETTEQLSTHALLRSHVSCVRFKARCLFAINEDIKLEIYDKHMYVI